MKAEMPQALKDEAAKKVEEGQGEEPRQENEKPLLRNRSYLLLLQGNLFSGFGACMGCSCETISGPKRICKEGPVLSSQEVLWTKD